jgi:hypothetical protein
VFAVSFRCRDEAGTGIAPLLIIPLDTSPLCISLYTQGRKKEGKMEDEIMVIARMDRKKKIRLFHVLLDEQRTFSAWLRDQIDAYLAEKEPKGKKKQRKGA